MDKKIRWGILGLGGIAEKFARDMALVKGAELYAVASRDIKKAGVFAEKHQVPRKFGTYEGLMNCEDVDIIYIATPHDSHFEWAIKSMNCGRSVLCEKPLAVNLKQVNEMIECAVINNVFFMEAMWSRFNPVLLKVKNLIEQGKIGNVEYINADFCFSMMNSHKARVLTAELAGGALLDIGIYPVWLSYYLLGKPKSLKAQARFSDTGVDIQTDISFLYDQSMASLSCSFTTRSDMVARIYGEHGSIQIHQDWHHSNGYTMNIGGEIQQEQVELTGMGYSYEIIECNKCLREEKQESELWSWQNSRDLIGLLDEIRSHIGLKYPFE